MSEVVLRLDQVSKTYSGGLFNSRKVEAVKDASFEVRKGDVFGFLGPNGAGKTTIVRCLLGLTKYQSGAIIRFGKDRLDHKDFFSKTAYCPEESHFPMYLTGREMLIHWGRMYGLDKVKALKKADLALETVGLVEAANRRIKTYSKGMKQRIGLAGTILSDPELIIMDEPARGLDPLARRLVRDLLISLAESGKTIFMNSHILSEVERVCTRAAIISEGVIRKEFNMADLEQKESLEITARVDPQNISLPKDATTGADGLFHFSVKDTAALGEFAAKIAAAHGEIVAVEKGKVNLEDFFIQIIRGGQ